MAGERWQTKDLAEGYDYLAPDGSEIRLLLSVPRGGLAHCTLPAGGVSSAVRHQTVVELWFFVEGRGEVWRRDGSDEHVDEVGAGRSIGITTGVSFQFRNTGEGPLRFLIATMPEWPGPSEAEPVDGRWPS